MRNQHSLDAGRESCAPERDPGAPEEQHSGPYFTGTPRKPRYHLQDVKRAAQGRWTGILAASGISPDYLTGRHSKCPGCGGKDRFKFDDRQGNGSFFCNGGGNPVAGDGFTLLQHTHGWNFREALGFVAAFLNIAPEQSQTRPRTNYQGRPWREFPEIRGALLRLEIATLDRAQGRALSEADLETEQHAATLIREFLEQGGQIDE